MPVVNGVGEPDEGKPHVRFDEGLSGISAMVGLVRHSQRKRGLTDRPYLKLICQGLLYLPFICFPPMLDA